MTTAKIPNTLTFFIFIFGLSRQKKTFASILIMILVANVLFPILPHLSACE